MKYYRRKNELKNGVRVANRDRRYAHISTKNKHNDEAISRGYTKLLSFIELAK